MNNQPIIMGEEKRKLYATLKTRLKIAIEKEFYFEAIMLEYAIVEDRAASILLHTNVCKNPYDKKLSNKLNSIQHQYGKKHPIISKKFDISLIERIKVWKEKRNDSVHRSCSQPYDPEQLKELVQEGREIVRLLENCARRIITAASKA